MNLNFLWLLGFIFILLSCTKDKAAIKEEFEEFEEITLFKETFDSLGNWNALPDGIFDPDSSFVRVENGLLKLTFDPSQYGAAWLGAELIDLTIQEPENLDKIGIRVTLDQGYFQQLTRYEGNSGSIESKSKLRLFYNSMWIIMPNFNFGRTHIDSLFDPDAYKVEGILFEFISDEGENIYRVDGLDHPWEEVYFNKHPTSNYSLYLEFTIGHADFLDPRIDNLFIDELEIFTWKGERPE